MMNLDKATSILNEWLSLLVQMSKIEIDCDMSPDELTTNLDRRQQVIGRIQQLDAAMTVVRNFRFNDCDESAAAALDAIMTEGRQRSQEIRISNAETIEIAKQKRVDILARLKRSTLSKGYHRSNQTPKIRPPAIVDGNA